MIGEAGRIQLSAIKGQGYLSCVQKSQAKPTAGLDPHVVTRKMRLQVPHSGCAPVLELLTTATRYPI